MMVRWPLWVSLALVALLVTQAGAGSVDMDEPQRLVVYGLSSLPMDLESALGRVDGELLRVDEALDFAVVQAPVRSLSWLLPGHVMPDNRVSGASSYDDDQAAGTSHDPLRGNQWALDFLDMPSAWALEEGDRDVLVAVVDSGVDPDHEDLAGVPMQLGRDYVDGGTVSQDPHGHGTHITGTIAAVRGNHIGIAGLADVGTLQIRVLDANGFGWCSDIVSGIQAARFLGADVINISIGGALTCTIPLPVATLVTTDSLMIASAGNDGSDPVECANTSPAANLEIMAVAAVDSFGRLAGFSCRSPWVEIAAPGAGILATLPDDSYASWSGTSMAAPHVVATAALMKSANPDLSSEQLRALLIATADDSSVVWDNGYGFGIVDPPRAIEAAITLKE